jgi:hypothetical protein
MSGPDFIDLIDRFWVDEFKDSPRGSCRAFDAGEQATATGLLKVQEE